MTKSSRKKKPFNFGLGVRLPYRRGVSVIHPSRPWVRVMEAVLALLLLVVGGWVAVSSGVWVDWLQFSILLVLAATLIWDLLVPPNQPSYLLVTKRVIIQLHLGVRTRFAWKDFSDAKIDKPGPDQTSMGTALAENLNLITEQTSWAAVFHVAGRTEPMVFQGELFRNPQEAFDVLQVAIQEFLATEPE